LPEQGRRNWAVNLNWLRHLLEELRIASADAYEIEYQISMTGRLYLETEALQTELEQNLEEEEMRRASEDWSSYRKTFRQRRAKARALIRQLQRVQEDEPTGADHASLLGQSARIGNGKLPELRLPQFSGEYLRCLTALGEDPFSGSFPVNEALLPVIKENFPLALQREWDFMKRKNSALTEEETLEGTDANKWKDANDGEVSKYKARLVAKRYSQRAEIDYLETFEPAVRYESARTLLAIAADEDLEILQFD
ncbi:Retrovirus-related Pol polyprotein from transposon TNT 1-94, partial [Trichinella papuae]